jgi:hypothetical protein
VRKPRKDQPPDFLPLGIAHTLFELAGNGLGQRGRYRFRAIVRVVRGVDRSCGIRFLGQMAEEDADLLLGTASEYLKSGKI